MFTIFRKILFKRTFLLNIVLSLFVSIFFVLTFIKTNSNNYDKTVGNLKNSSNAINNIFVQIENNINSVVKQFANSSIFKKSIENKNYNISNELNIIKNTFEFKNIILLDSNNNFIKSTNNFESANTDFDILNNKIFYEGNLDEIYLKIPLVESNITYGYLFAIWSKEILHSFLNKLDNSSSILLFDNYGNILYTNLNFEIENINSLLINKKISNKNIGLLTYNNKNYFFSEKYDNEFNISIYSFEIQDSMISTNLFFVLLGISLFFLFILNYLTQKNKNKPIQNINYYLNKISQGDTDIDIKIDDCKETEKHLLKIIEEINTIYNETENIKSQVSEGKFNSKFWNDKHSGAFYLINQNFIDLNNLYLNFIDEFTVPIILVDYKLNVFYVNQKAQYLSEKQHNRIINKNLYISFDFGDFSQDESALKKSIKTKKAETSKTQLFIDENIYDISYTVIPILKNNIITSFFIYILDQTDVISLNNISFNHQEYEEKRLKKLIQSLDVYSKSFGTPKNQYINKNFIKKEV